MWNGTMSVDLDWPLNASSLLSASAELLVNLSIKPNYVVTKSYGLNLVLELVWNQVVSK